MGWRLPIPMDVLNPGTALDPGTLSRQRNSPPGSVNGSGYVPCNIPGPILVGKPPRDPGKNEDGTVYEDMLANDNPAKAAALKTDPVFGLDNARLIKMGRDLMDSVSRFDLNTVANKAWDRFVKGTGGTFTDDKLTEKVLAHEKHRAFVDEFRERLRKAILEKKCDLHGFTPLPIGRYAFESDLDKAGGLGILIHDWWSIKAELKDYVGAWDEGTQTGAFYGTLVYTLTDDFGLDWMDIVQHGDDTMPPAFPPPFTTGDRFKAWYVLQHFRDRAKPFFVQVTQEVTINDGSARKV